MPQVKPVDLIGFNPSLHAIVSGASGRGKTEYTVDAILGTGVHKGRPGQWDAVMIMCDNISIGQKAYERLKKKWTGKGMITFVEGLPKTPEEEEIILNALERNKNNGHKTILIIDDLMTASTKGSEKRFVDKLFTSARHLDTAIWELNQAHTTSRTRRLQVGYLICFATPSDVRGLAHVARSIKPETKGRDILAAYREATESRDGHGCLVISLGQPGPFMFRNTDMAVAIDMETLENEMRLKGLI